MSKQLEAIITHPSLVREQWLSLELAVREVLAFERRFGSQHLLLACHVALPLILTSELVNLIHLNFLDQAQIPWIAEVDFLLSPLCRPIDEGLYEVEPAVREVLLVELENKFGWERTRELAKFLQFYLDHQSPQQREDVFYTQSWIAQAYIDPDRVVEELTNWRSDSLTVSDLLPLHVQLATTLEILAEPLERTSRQAEYQYLVHDSRVLAHLLYGDEVKKSEIQKEVALLSPVMVRWLSGTDTSVMPPLQILEFDVVTVEVERSQHQQNVIIHRHRHQNQYFAEDLGGVTLEMLKIKSGEFLMGSPTTEAERFSNEGPNHWVKVAPFFMSNYPITQRQWQAVAALPMVNRLLDPDPSHFKGSSRPVEQVSWYATVEFCDRLTAATGREYRLPSEAEWEYACRAGTTTPYHFGETITPELANYDGNYIYGAGSKGEYREQTTTVNHFGVANAFGLYDMHGNVYEWCADHFHNNYEGAPADSRIWIDLDNKYRVSRGGSWVYYPRNCRSAFRLRNVPDHQNYNLGFRVVVSCTIAHE
ncbi:MAG: formylglycine-generating enzyme family protein [Nostocaceae cyanobacterium]|nr:formylglycine-generating enzyme family protein [Nostocaceae cyanobacterium]